MYRLLNLSAFTSDIENRPIVIAKCSEIINDVVLDIELIFCRFSQNINAKWKVVHMRVGHTFNRCNDEIKIEFSIFNRLLMKQKRQEHTKFSLFIWISFAFILIEPLILQLYNRNMKVIHGYGFVFRQFAFFCKKKNALHFHRR